MSRINAYIGFNGNCREAMNFYKDCFGGNLEIMTVGDTPVADQMPPGSKDNVMHAYLLSGNMALMASDMGKTSNLEGPISVCIECDSDEQINSFFTKLSEGGTVNMPLEVMFWGGKFGQVTDKFGLTWSMNFGGGEQPQ